jgi:hypothetical protein
MELFGTHKVSYDTLRSLAIQCHALDITAYHLLFDSTHIDEDGKTKAIYEELFTNKLLALAIALRTKFYQGLDHKATIPQVSHCGFLYSYKQTEESIINVSIKDICDKIIHADSVSRFLEQGIDKPTTTLQGRYKGNNWELSMSVSLFAEAVLNWVQIVQKTI